MKIIFLGTNGWYDTKTGNTTCTLIETRDEYILLDAGGGFSKIGDYITRQKPIYLFLSHFHLDHIIGLHALSLFKFRQGIDVYGPSGLTKFFNTVINRPYTMPLSGLKTRIRLAELKRTSTLPIMVEFKKLLHSSLCYGYRFTLEGKVVSYCTDTGKCDNLLGLARKADLLITECSYVSKQWVKAWPHLNPEDAASVAREACSKKLFLMHFDAKVYPALKDRKKAVRAAKKIFKNAFAAYDNMKIGL